MEDSAVKDQSSASGGRSASKLLRYPLRSSTKSKEEKPPLADSSTTTTKRGRLASTVSKSVANLDLSGKDKPAKPPRRLSVPSKSTATASPAAKSLGNITPISEARAKRSIGNHTPVSDVSRSSARKKFSILSSASYWLSQIKLSESAAKHSISLGFFKLAFEARCEPIQRISDELKAYVQHHNLSEFGDMVKELLGSYKISENFEPSQGSETGSEVPAEGNQLSDDDVNSSSSSITDAEKLQPKLLDINASETHKAKEANNETTHKIDVSEKKTKRSAPKNAASLKLSSSEVRGRSTQKKPQKSIKQEPAQDKDKVKKQGKKSVPEEVPLNSPSEEALQENKENMAASQMVEEIISTEV